MREGRGVDPGRRSARFEARVGRAAARRGSGCSTPEAYKERRKRADRGVRGGEFFDELFARVVDDGMTPGGDPYGDEELAELRSRELSVKQLAKVVVEVGEGRRAGVVSRAS